MTYADELIDENNDTDIFLRFSNDNGATWSAPLQVNDGDGTTGNSQFFQNISVDQSTGIVFIGWLDARNDRDDGSPGDTDTDNQANSEVEYFVTASLDGGAGFLLDKLVSNGTSDEDRADPNANDFGDYTGIAAIGGSAYMAWPDNSNSTGNNPGGNTTFDIYVDRVRVASTLGQTITATGSAGADNYVVRLDASGTFIQIYENTATTGVPTYTATLASVNNIVVNGNNGNDTLTVDYTNGNPIPSGGINYSGGENVGDNDTLVVKSYNVGTVTVNHLGTENGNVNLAGSKITFSQIEPLALSGTAADLVINLPAGPNTNVVVGNDTNANFPGLGLNVANTSAIDASTFEYTSFTNPTNSLTVNLNNGGDTATLKAMDATFNPAGTAVTAPFMVVGGSGADVVNVQATTARTNVNVGGGADTINVSSNAPLNTGDLNALDAVLETHPGDFNIGDSQNISESGNGAGDTVRVDGISNVITYSGTAGGGWRIDGEVFKAGTLISTGSGVETFNVVSSFVTEPITIKAGGGNDVFNISSNAPTNTGDLDLLDSLLTLDGQGGSNQLNVSNSGNAAADTVAITSNSITGTTGGGYSINYSATGGTFASGVRFDGGSGGNTISVSSTLAGAPTTVNSGSGVDTVNVTTTNPTGPLSINSGSGLDNINIGNTGTVGLPGLLPRSQVQSQ